MICLKCGKNLPDNSVVCPECGYQFANTQPLNTQPLNEFADVSVSKAPAKKSHKKAIIITSTAVVAAVAVGVPTFFAVKNGSQKQYMNENPTKYLAHSFGQYLETKEKDDAMYSVLSGLRKTGSLKLTVNNDYINGSALFGFDIDQKQEYIDMSGEYGGGYIYDPQKINVQAYVDNNSLNVNYDVADNKGSYFLDFPNLRKDYDASIFADSNSSVYNSQIEQIVDGLEKYYDLSQKNDQMKKDFENTATQILKSLETNGHVEIKSETATVEQKNYSADLVTYTFRSDDIKTWLTESKNYLIDYMKQYNDDFSKLYDSYSIDDIEKSLDSSIDSLNYAYNADLELKLEFYIDSKTGCILKVQYTQTEGDNTGNIVMEFPPDSETVFDMNVTGSGEKYGSDSYHCSLTKTNTANGYTYKFNNNNSSSLTFDYDKTSSKMKVTHDVGNDGSSSNDLTLSSLFSNSYALKNNFTMEFDFECTNDKLMIGEDGWRLEVSSNSNITPFKAEKNFLQITEDELNQLTGGTIGGNSIIENAQTSQRQTNAYALNSACKKLYAGVYAGSITQDSYDYELGNLDKSKLPPANATASQRREIAQNLTIQDAINYDGLTSTFADESPFDYGYNNVDGTIEYLDSDIDINQYTMLISFDDTTLGELYHTYNRYNN